jgi:hypothetical protein
MDVTSLYTVIPHHDGLRALKFFLDKRPNQEPSTAVFVRLAELVATAHHQQFLLWWWALSTDTVSGVTMGTKMGTNYANWFVGFVKEQIFEQHTCPVPD